MKIVDRLIDALFVETPRTWSGAAKAWNAVEAPTRPSPTTPNGSIDWGDEAELNLAELHLTTAVAAITGFVQVDDDALTVAERSAADAVYALRRIRANRNRKKVQQ